MLTIIIPTYKLSKFRRINLEFLYHRLEEQIPNCRVVIANQYSHEDEDYYKKFDEVIYLKNDSQKFNKKFLINQTLGSIKEDKNEFLMFLDCDIYFRFKNLESHLNNLLQEEKIVKPFKECIYLTKKLTSDFMKKRKIALPESLKKVVSFWREALIVRKSLMKEQKFFDEKISLGWNCLPVYKNTGIKVVDDFSVHLYHQSDCFNESKSKIVHVFNIACLTSSHRLHKAQTKSIESFQTARKKLDVTFINVSQKDCLKKNNIKNIAVSRTALDLGHNKDFPFLNDVVNSAIPFVKEDDWVLYTNSDCSASKTLYQTILKCNADYIELKRQDVDERGTHIRTIERGTDGFAIKKGLLKKIPIPDLLIGAPYWDDVISKLYSSFESTIVSNELIHVEHETTYDLNKLDIAGQTNYNQFLKINCTAKKELVESPKPLKVSDYIDFNNLFHFKNKLECICLLVCDRELSDKYFYNFINQIVKKTPKEHTKDISFKIFINKSSSLIPKEAVASLKQVFEFVDVINLNLEKHEDLYLKRDLPTKEPLPELGYLSGPNKMFYDAIKVCSEYNTTLLLETDCLLGKNWLHRINDYIRTSNGFWISGSMYDGNANFEKYMKSHINGGTCLCATGDSNFQKFLDLFYDWFKITVKTDNYLAYDYGIKKFIMSNTEVYQNIEKERKIWQFIDRMYARNNLIFNLSVHVDKLEDIKRFNELFNFAILHTKASCDF
jgi:hypothetical protein